VKNRSPAKTCRRCGETKDPSEFRRNGRMKDGLDSWCSACHVEATRRWREQNPEKVEAANARRRAAYAAKRAAQDEKASAERQKREKELHAVWQAHQRRVETFRRERIGEAAKEALGPNL
jgi:uncharacterized Zn finger protein (UPF0148 family)